MQRRKCKGENAKRKKRSKKNPHEKTAHLIAAAGGRAAAVAGRGSFSLQEEENRVRKTRTTRLLKNRNWQAAELLLSQAEAASSSPSECKTKNSHKKDLHNKTLLKKRNWQAAELLLSQAEAAWGPQVAVGFTFL